LQDLAPVPLGYDVEAAEGYDAKVGSQVVDVAALEALLINLMRKAGAVRNPRRLARQLDFCEFFE